MKKLLSLLGLVTTSVVTTSNVIACTGFVPNINPSPNPPSPPTSHDIAYYEQEITSIKKQITQIQKDINDMNSRSMKMQICGSNTMCQELQQLIDSSTAEVKKYQAEEQDDQYQILVLKTGGNFNLEEKQQARKYLQTELNLLNDRKALMLKIPDYSKTDLNNLNQQILLIKQEQAKLKPQKKGTHKNDINYI